MSIWMATYGSIVILRSSSVISVIRTGKSMKK
ncbi:hypothetical protein PENANT_c464G05788 [Penicillium antarcticum]|uniref:Uncharacterized protein n=1 Tax=Penicillium antarcticum TaxID=416450 RepID=A0A1V6NGB6_9EURO|nr:hypothetical protein PENANT_c464G05788 [Penicillium antarcticum]